MRDIPIRVFTAVTAAVTTLAVAFAIQAGTTHNAALASGTAGNAATASAATQATQASVSQSGGAVAVSSSAPTTQTS
jgi:hypothetical protein